jgi:hypothetical protein
MIATVMVIAMVFLLFTALFQNGISDFPKLGISHCLNDRCGHVYLDRGTILFRKQYLEVNTVCQSGAPSGFSIL